MFALTNADIPRAPCARSAVLRQSRPAQKRGEALRSNGGAAGAYKKQLLAV